MAVQEVPSVSKACLLLIFMVSAAPADEAELHTAVARLTDLKMDGIWLHSFFWALQEALLRFAPLPKYLGSTQ